MKSIALGLLAYFSVTIQFSFVQNSTSQYYSFNNSFESSFLQNLSILDSLNVSTFCFSDTLLKTKDYILLSGRFNSGSNSCRLSIEPGNEPSFEMAWIHFYQSKTNAFFNLSYNYLSDAETNEMNFKFENDSTIILQETALIGGEELEDGSLEEEEFMGNGFMITITKDDSLYVEQIKTID